jgi:CheY-like chemotaxis protein
MEQMMIFVPTEPTYKPRILIVDGHRQVAEAVGFLLERTGFFSVTLVYDTLEARMEIQASGCFDLLLIDIEAPGTESGKMLEQLIGLNRPFKTVVLIGGSTTLNQSPPFLSEVFFFKKSQPVTDLIQIIISAMEEFQRFKLKETEAYN